MLLTAKAKSIFLGALFVPALAQSGDKEHGMLRRALQDTPPGNIIEMLGENNEQDVSFDRFLEYIAVSGLDYTEGMLTMFAPTDEALVKFESEVINFEPANPEDYYRAGAFLRYQAVAGARLSTDFEDGEVDIDGSGYENNFTQNPFAVNGAPVLIPDILATNGVIHAINPLGFPEGFWAFTDIMDTLALDDSFSTLISLLEATGLDVPLRTGKYTLFPPTNNAITNLGDENIAFFNEPDNEDLLKEVLLFHVVEKVYCSCDIAAAGGILVLPTLQGENITIDATGFLPFIEDAVLNPFNINVLAGNGLLHEISDVLLPSTVDIKRPTGSPTQAPTMPVPTEGGEVSLKEVGNNGIPMAVFPLGKCEGDCDSDSDCSDSLKCFKSDSMDTIPGCVGSRRPTKAGGLVDYCHEPTGDEMPHLSEVGNNGEPAAVFPLDICEGDCDTDSDCAGELKCFDATGDADVVPGCSGTRRKNKAGHYVDFCYAV